MDPRQDDRQSFGPLDAVLPKDMAKRAERTGAEKAEQDALSLLTLAVMAGAYIAFGATFAAAVSAGAEGPMAGVTELAGGFAFTLAYVLAIVGGAELFTTNVLTVMAWVHGRLSTRRLLRAWGIVFVGNFVGAVVTGAMLIAAGQHMGGGGAVGAALLESAVELAAFGPLQALLLGTLGNTLLCLGVWLTYSGRSTTDRILALAPPVAAFYVLGLEHAVAVMFYLPCAALISLFAGPEFWTATGAEPLTIGPGQFLGDFLGALLPVTAGNVLGGGLLVALTYWFIYLRPYDRHV